MNGSYSGLYINFYIEQPDSEEKFKIISMDTVPNIFKVNLEQLESIKQSCLIIQLHNASRKNLKITNKFFSGFPNLLQFKLSGNITYKDGIKIKTAEPGKLITKTLKNDERIKRIADYFSSIMVRQRLEQDGDYREFLRQHPYFLQLLTQNEFLRPALEQTGMLEYLRIPEPAEPARRAPQIPPEELYKEFHEMINEERVIIVMTDGDNRKVFLTTTANEIQTKLSQIEAECKSQCKKLEIISTYPRVSLEIPDLKDFPNVEEIDLCGKIEFASPSQSPIPSQETTLGEKVAPKINRREVVIELIDENNKRQLFYTSVNDIQNQVSQIPTHLRESCKSLLVLNSNNDQELIIHDKCFAGFKNLINVALYGNITQVDKNVFGDNDFKALYVPEKLERFALDYTWLDYVVADSNSHILPWLNDNFSKKDKPRSSGFKVKIEDNPEMVTVKTSSEDGKEIVTQFKITESDRFVEWFNNLQTDNRHVTLYKNQSHEDWDLTDFVFAFDDKVDVVDKNELFDFELLSPKDITMQLTYYDNEIQNLRFYSQQSLIKFISDLHQNRRNQNRRNQNRRNQNRRKVKKIILENRDQDVSFNIPDDLFCDKKFSNLEEVNLLGNILSIGRASFYELPSLKKVTMPDTLTCILIEAFAYSKSLTDAPLSKNLLYVESDAFKSTALKNITISESVVDIEQDAFKCLHLKTANIRFSNKMFNFAGATETGFLLYVFGRKNERNARFNFELPRNYQSNPLLKKIYEEYLHTSNVHFSFYDEIAIQNNWNREVQPTEKNDEQSAENGNETEKPLFMEPTGGKDGR